MSRASITLLGTGCSTGVPRIDGYWGACDPQEPKNRRSRCSAMVSIKQESARNLHILIDTAPDLRHQALAYGLSHIDHVLFTHDHADQTHGIDDLRAFTFQKGPLPCHLNHETFQSLHDRFCYVFEGKYGYPPLLNPNIFSIPGEPLVLESENDCHILVHTFEQIHGPIKSVGYRIGNMAYSSDVSDLDEKAMMSLEGLDLWVVDALRYKPHPTHAHLDKTLSWISDLKPKRAVLTNLHQDLDYLTLSKLLPSGVEVGFDQMSLNFSLSLE